MIQGRSDYTSSSLYGLGPESSGQAEWPRTCWPGVCQPKTMSVPELGPSWSWYWGKGQTQSGGDMVTVGMPCLGNGVLEIGGDADPRGRQSSGWE